MILLLMLKITESKSNFIVYNAEIITVRYELLLWSVKARFNVLIF